MPKKLLSLLTIFSFCIVSSSLSFAHGGRTNKDGCHTNKKTGEYHCHDKKKKKIAKKKSKQHSSSKNKKSQSVAPQISSSSPQSYQHDELLRLDYPGFTIWLDCERKGAVKFRYNAQRDTGNKKRHSQFYIDPKVPEKCQQTSTKAYSKGYDRGHLVPANHMDFSKESIRVSNYMTNVLPQVSQMNRGAWLQSEEIIECYRDIDELLVLGGVIWGDDKSDDFFVESHGVKTPDAFWKVIIRGRSGDERANAWIIPNSKKAKRKNLDEYLVAPSEIEKITGEKLPIPDYLRNEKPRSSWLIPMGCNRS